MHFPKSTLTNFPILSQIPAIRQIGILLHNAICKFYVVWMINKILEFKELPYFAIKKIKQNKNLYENKYFLAYSNIKFDLL